ncbi:MAG: Aminobutyraldehyde dehydrogenase [Rhodocyclales bacterium]|nr:Aminobutyraldehyde dehydrogenase [Rhodocyclales bacterium]
MSDIHREHTEAVVIGAGAIGLACARALALRGIETIVIERHDGIGQETSSRNSEVIHAGLYYPAQSLKASLCTRGRRLLYEYCDARHIPFRRCGKLIVATRPDEEEKLGKILQQAYDNGVEDVAFMSAAAMSAREPALRCVSALESPSTGIIDSHAFMLALQADAESAGAAIAFNTALVRGTVLRGGTELLVRSGNEVMLLEANILINAAGLSAPAVASLLEGLDANHVPRTWFAKGNYYSLAGRAPFSSLIYPIPESGGLGVHLTLDLGGQARFGPDVEWVDELEYSVDPGRSKGFYAEVRKYWPELPDGALYPAYCGIRPKLAGPGQPNADFVIQGASIHGHEGLINLFGIESPGLTASLAIADQVCIELGLPSVSVP